ncbi:DUF4136 domain-containing protein [Pedobacter sp. N36a]|uniref:DUF4136 domain-containing protein n=1 Tax=Pedobacter sp. N36a TaxID=2767996 RepID=UPI001656A216|nr:DUF4136 domain-containing protein [Pedobacter sp. N36a]MBC8985175.1 DUF4136 domain-containing protein [Pedobacter sp. N36a]
MKRQLLFLLVATGMLSACSPYNYYAVGSKPVGTDFKTYAWLPPEDAKTNNIYNNDIVTDKIVQTTETELAKKGLTLDSKNPDLLIRYSAIVNKSMKIYDEPIYYNQPPMLSPRIAYYQGRARFFYVYDNPFPVYVGSRERKMPIKEGNIMIDIIERSSSKVIWRGWAEGELTDPQKAINEIPKVVENIFKQLP